MFEKGMHKSWKMLQNGAKMGAKIENKSIKNEVQKSMRKKARPGTLAQRVAPSNVLNISKRLVFVF